MNYSNNNYGFFNQNLDKIKKLCLVISKEDIFFLN